VTGDDLRAIGTWVDWRGNPPKVTIPAATRDALADLIDAAEEVWRCKRCNGGGLIAPGACCQTCAGDGIRVEWDDDGSDLRPLIDALAALDQEAPA
jgi:RecJ-like exonuclease